MPDRLERPVALPSTAFEIALDRALDGIGVEPGQGFAVVPYRDGPAPGENQLGRWRARSDTARKAALANYPRSGNQRHRILLYAVAEGARRGITSDEVARDLKIPLYSAKPRMSELRDGGWLERRKHGDSCYLMRLSPNGAGTEIHWPTAKALREVRDAS